MRIVLLLSARKRTRLSDWLRGVSVRPDMCVCEHKYEHIERYRLACDSDVSNV